MWITGILLGCNLFSRYHIHANIIHCTHSRAIPSFAHGDHVCCNASCLAPPPRLPSSDHRRAVRPKARKVASATHLKMLTSRSNVTSELRTPVPEKVEGEGPKVDPNTYSTYMRKCVSVRNSHVIYIDIACMCDVGPC